MKKIQKDIKMLQAYVSAFGTYMSLKECEIDNNKLNGIYNDKAKEILKIQFITFKKRVSEYLS